MEQAHALTDCPGCRGVRTVILDVCYICFAQFVERRDDDLDATNSVNGEAAWSFS